MIPPTEKMPRVQVEASERATVGIAADSLVPAVYHELRRLAHACLRHERKDHTLQATALVNEAYVRLAAERPREFANKTHFLAIAALSMRQILVQRARARNAAKRGGGGQRVTLDERVMPQAGGVHGGADR